nr:iron-containing alcohol dehydrogenase [Mediterranea massiliensis]
MGLCAHRFGQGTTDCRQAAAHHCHYHYGRYGLGNGQFGCHHQRRHVRESVCGRCLPVSGTLHRRPGTDGKRAAYHPALPHGAGLIMISKAYYKYFIEHHACDDRFVRMAQAMGMPEATKPEDFLTALTRLQEACGVADLKMSDYGITPDEFETLMRNTREVMGIMFTSDRVQMTDEDIVNVYQESYK